MRPNWWVTVVFACVGCSVQPTVTGENFLSYDYDVNDNIDAAIRANAEALCRQRKKLAIRTEFACVLPRCSTTYQCMNEADARESGLLPSQQK